MRRFMRRNLAFFPALVLVFLALFGTSAIADTSTSPWSWRADFVYISSSDFDPIDNLFGLSLNLLHDMGSNFRVGGEVQWVTGDDDDSGVSLDADWFTLLAVGEYSFIDRSLNDYEIYVNMGLGLIFVDVDGSFGSDDDTSIAFRPAVGANIFFTETVGLNVQAGYLWSEVDFGRGDEDAGGFEGKIGITVTY